MGFYKWISILSEICSIHCSKLPLSSLIIFISEIELLTYPYSHAILGSVNTGVNTEAIFFPDFIIASPKLEFQPIIGFDEV